MRLASRPARAFGLARAVDLALGVGLVLALGVGLVLALGAAECLPLGRPAAALGQSSPGAEASALPGPTGVPRPTSVAGTSAPRSADGVAQVTPPPMIVAGGDPRSEGSGPGLVGSPLLILLGVVVLGLSTAAVTALVARLARRS